MKQGQALRLECEQQSHVYAGLFVLDRIQAINTRFGSAGNEVLILFQKHLLRGLLAGDELFRWGPDSFLALLPRTESGELVRRELRRFLSARLEETFEIGARSVTLPIASTWTVIPLFESGYNQNLRKLDAFRAAIPG
jgi:GGDEF domain-containing protein